MNKQFAETSLPRSTSTQITKSSQLLLRLINFFLSTRQFCYVFILFILGSISYIIITNRIYTNYSLSREQNPQQKGNCVIGQEK